MEYELEFVDGICLVTTRGTAELAPFLRYIDEMLHHPAWKTGTPMLHDHSALDAARLHAGDIREIADHSARHREALGESRLAVVTSREVEFGLARMWQTLSQDRIYTDAQVFRDRDEALAWLHDGGA